MGEDVKVAPMTRRLFLLAAVAAATLLAADFSGKVVRISDGDTIRVMHNGVAERIRLWGIDSPESKQAFGTRAKQFTGDLAFGKIVAVHVRDVDHYGRTVAEIILQDGRNLNREIVRAGFAWWLRALRTAGNGAARFAERGEGGEARLVGRSESGAAVGVEASGSGGAAAVESTGRDYPLASRADLSDKWCREEQ
jgi:endonuclease YncB( thermonuclease family)